MRPSGIRDSSAAPIGLASSNSPSAMNGFRKTPTSHGSIPTS